DLLAKARPRIVADALVLLLENDVALGQDDVVGELEPGHAVSLELHDCSKLLAWDALEVARIVLRRKCVLLTADAGDNLREFSGRVFRRALEHQVLEKMRQTRFARSLVGRT